MALISIMWGKWFLAHAFSVNFPPHDKPDQIICNLLCYYYVRINNNKNNNKYAVRLFLLAQGAQGPTEDKISQVGSLSNAGQSIREITLTSS